jgi:threonine dehydrogenase-like Zn-dependent dehydrogenase
VNAVVVERPGKVGVQQVDDPAPGPREVLVRVEACGICGTDIHLLDGDSPLAPYPLIPGHVFCGEVVTIGAEVDVVDVTPSRLPVAERLGADRSATSAAELNQPHGWEVVIDATGVVAAIEDGLRRAARGGTFLMFGVAPAEAAASFSPFRVYNEEINIVGSMAVLHSFERARDLLVGGVIDAEAMITQRLALDSYEDAVAAFRAGAGLKIQVTSAATGQAT